MRSNAMHLAAVVFLGLAAPAIAQNAVSTVAGGGSNNVAARSASIGSAQGIAMDGSGNLYVADSGLNRVYKVSAAGELTVVAGNGGNNFTGASGAAISAQLGAPQGVALDASGNLYIAVPPPVGSVLEVDAQTGVISSAFPYYGSYNDAINGVFIDASGKIYISQGQNCDVAIIDPATLGFKTVAGVSQSCGYTGDGGLATSAELFLPEGIFVDKSGNVFIADSGNNVIREVNAATGKITTIAGNGTAGYSGDGGAATSAELSGPYGVWVDGSGNLLIADTGNNVVRKVTGGRISTVAGNGKQGLSGDGGLATSAELNGPTAILVDASGNMFIAESDGIREVVAATKDIETYAGNGYPSYAGDGGLATNAQLFSPSGVFADALGNLYIADQYNNAVREVVASTGKIRDVAGNGTEGYTGDGGLATSATLAMPYGVFGDAAGNVFIADSGNNVIREVAAATGTISTVAGNGTAGYTGDRGPATSAQLNGPFGVFVDRAGDIYIADSGNNAIREVVAATGLIKTVAGTGIWGYSGDGGLATGAQLMDPTALFVDGSGNVFIADTGNNAIREVTEATGKIATVAGNGTAGDTGDGGLATSAEIYMPSGIYVDGGGNIFITAGYSYVSNYEGDAVREVSASTKDISTVAGDGYSSGYLDSPTATLAQFNGPMGMAGDRAGNLFVADSGNNVIRKIAGILGTDIAPAAPPPTFSPVEGVYPVAQSVKLADSVSTATMYYTTTGGTPTTGSTKYTTGINVSSSTTIQAVAIASGDSLSPVAQASYTITTTAPAPTFSPLPGSFVTAQTVSLSTDVVGATIHYTTNNSTPTAASATYTKPIAVSSTTTINAIAVATGFKSSAVGSGVYTIQTQVATPSFTPEPRGYWTPQAVTLKDSTAGAAIYYTIDGTTPTAKSAKYVGTAIPVSKSTTIKAIAIVTGDVSSLVASGVYTIDDSVLVEERVLAQQGIGIGLATQTFLSQLSLAENVLLFGNDGVCGDASATLLALTQTGHTGGIIPWSPSTPNTPGYGTIYYDNLCTQPWAQAELYDWTMSLDLTTFSLAGSTKETEVFFGPSGTVLGTMNLAETMDVTLTGNTLASTYGLGTFTPQNGGPAAQLGLACSVNLYGFLLESEPAVCEGGMLQDFPDLGVSLGFLLPIKFTPVITPGVAWTGSQFVAVSSSGAILTSSDGSKWTPQFSQTGNNLRAVASTGSQLVAVGSAGTILTSHDGGLEWRSQRSGTSANLAAVARSGSEYVAVGVEGTTGVIVTSPNGTSWTARNTGIVTPALLQGVASSGKLFVVVGVDSNSGPAILTSADGIAWSSTSSITGSTTSSGLEAVTWSGTQFVAVGQESSIGQATVLFSTDGKTWNEPSSYSSVPTENILYGVVWSPQKKLYVAVGQNGTILTSPDANTWTASTSNTTKDLKAVTWSGTKFAAIGTGNTVLTSPDGVVWTVQTSMPGQGELLQFSSSGSSLVSGPLGGLQMTSPTPQTLAISGGTPYGTAAFKGYAGDLAVFIPTPTGWTATDTAHDQQFQMALSDDVNRNFTGSIKKISTGVTLTTFTVDRSGTGTITYSDGSKAAVTNWLPAD